MQKFLNSLWEFTRGEEDRLAAQHDTAGATKLQHKDNFNQKALKVCKVFKVKPLKTPKLDVPSKTTAYNLFCKDIRKIKKGLQDVPVSKTNAIIPKEWKKS